MNILIDFFVVSSRMTTSKHSTNLNIFLTLLLRDVVMRLVYLKKSNHIKQVPLQMIKNIQLLIR